MPALPWIKGKAPVNVSRPRKKSAAPKDATPRPTLFYGFLIGLPFRRKPVLQPAFYGPLQ